MSLEQELLQLKEDILDRKENITRMRGEYDSLMRQLADEFKIRSVKEGDKKVQALSEQIKSLEISVQEIINKIQEILNGKDNTELE